MMTNIKPGRYSGKQATERLNVRFATGTLAQVSAVLRDKETQAEFIRIAVAKEVKRRSSSIR